MSKFFKKIINNISDVLGLTTNALEDLIKENEQYLEAELELAKEHEEAINTLKEYSNIETSSLAEAMETLATTYENIEHARREKVELLKGKFIGPLKELLENLKIKKIELKEAEDAEKDLEKAQQKFDKQESKPEEKRKPEKLAITKAALEEAKKKYDKEKAEATITTEAFNKTKIEILKEILENTSEIEKKFYQNAVEMIISVKIKAESINIGEVSTIEEEDEIKEDDLQEGKDE